MKQVHPQRDALHHEVHARPYERMAAPGLNPDGYINLRGFGEDIDWWVSRGYMPSRVEPASVVDHSFVEYALARLGPYSR